MSKNANVTVRTLAGISGRRETLETSYPIWEINFRYVYIFGVLIVGIAGG